MSNFEYMQCNNECTCPVSNNDHNLLAQYVWLILFIFFFSNCLILFCGMNTLWNTVAPMQSTLCSEWKTWKQDVMKWFSAPPSLSSSKDTQQQSYDDLYQANLQVCRKGPNLKFMVQIHMLHKWKSRTKL